MQELIIQSKLYAAQWEELTAEQQQLVTASQDAIALSHSPYSKFKVGCAIRLASGQIVLGANQENAAYPMCLCAEGTALSAAASQYFGDIIVSVAIYVPIAQPASPCGYCRQSFKEYEGRMQRKFEYILASNESYYLFEGIDTILPLAFSSSDLISS